MWKMPSKVGHMGATTIKRTTFDLSESGWKQSAKFEFSGKNIYCNFFKVSIHATKQFILTTKM